VGPWVIGLSIAHWEAVNILVALRTWGDLVRGWSVVMWCDNMVAVSVCSVASGKEPILNVIIRNIWLVQSQLDCHIGYKHIRGSDN
jgi:hypothetical protein